MGFTMTIRGYIESATQQIRLLWRLLSNQKIYPNPITPTATPGVRPMCFIHNLPPLSLTRWASTMSSDKEAVSFLVHKIHLNP